MDQNCQRDCNATKGEVYFSNPTTIVRAADRLLYYVSSAE